MRAVGALVTLLLLGCGNRQAPPSPAAATPPPAHLQPPPRSAGPPGPVEVVYAPPATTPAPARPSGATR